MKVVLRAVLRRYALEPGVAGMESAQRRSITVSPREGARVVLTERDRSRAQPETVSS
jgi:hypothetical protein